MRDNYCDHVLVARSAASSKPGTNMSCGSKRKSEEWDVSEIQECTSAEVHFVVSELSPIKESRKNKKVKYFDLRVTDGKVARAISFEPSLRAAFAESKDKGTPIKLLNCSVKPVTGQADKFEIFANNHSKVMKSPKKFVIGEECMYSRLSCHKFMTCQLIK